MWLANDYLIGPSNRRKFPKISVSIWVKVVRFVYVLNENQRKILNQNYRSKESNGKFQKQ